MTPCQLTLKLSSVQTPRPSSVIPAVPFPTVDTPTMGPYVDVSGPVLPGIPFKCAVNVLPSDFQLLIGRP